MSIDYSTQTMSDVESATIEPQLTSGEEISFIDLILVLAVNRNRIFYFTFCSIVVAIVAVLLMPKQYKSQTVLLTPIRPTSVATSVMGELGGALAGLNAGDSLGLKDPNDVYVAMLHSRTIADALIQRFKLQEYYKTGTLIDTEEMVAAHSDIASGHDGTITIAFEHKDPKVAAQIANAYVEELQKLSQTVAVTEAQQRTVFFSRQLEKTKDELAKAEVDLRKSQEKTGLLDFDKQATAIVGAIAELQGNIAGQEVLITGLRAYGTDRNPDVVRAQQQLAQMKTQLAQLEKRKGSGEGDILVSTKALPSLGLDYLRALRNVKYYEAVYEVLAKQYEASVVDAATNGDVIQVIEQATPPDKKSKPKRGIIVIAIAFAAFLGSYCWFVFKSLYKQMAGNPKIGPKLQVIKGAFSPSGGWGGVFRRTRSGSGVSMTRTR